MEQKAFALLDHKNTDAGEFSGYASCWSRDLHGDIIEPGAFGKCIEAKRGRVPVLLHHDRERWCGASTMLAEDTHGLRIVGKLFTETSPGREAYGLLKGAREIGCPVGLSIGFVPADWKMDGETRRITEIDLWECSIVPFPAQPRAGVSDVKTLDICQRVISEATGCTPEQSRRALVGIITRGVFDIVGGELAPSHRELREWLMEETARLRRVQ